MSYAAAAARGPKQSPEEARAPAMPEVAHDDSSASSLPDVDTPHISSVPSSYDGETSTSASRHQHEADEAERASQEIFDQVSRDASQGYDKAKEGAKKAEAGMERAGERFEEGVERAKKVAARKGREGKEMMQELGEEARENQDNPVVVGNAVVVGLGAVLLGVGAYQKHTAGQLTWKLVGMWAGAIGLFAAGDYYLSLWLFRNKYPPRK